MSIKIRIDPVRVGEEIFYKIFHHIFHDEGARHYFNFSNISFFTTSEGYPGWNLWFEGTSGAYQLILLNAQEVFDDDRLSALEISVNVAVEGRFLVRYFPSENDPGLDDYSCSEVLLRLGPLFDCTGTPTLAGQERINGNFFVVGFLDFRTDIQRTFLELECIAPNRWKDIRVDGLYLKTAEGEEYEAVTPGDVDRNLVGWDSAFILFDKVISACCYAYKCSPLAAIIAEKSWVRFNIDRDNVGIEISDSDIGIYHLISVFKINGKDFKPPKKDNYFQIISDQMTADGFQLLNVSKQTDLSLNNKINPDWWEVKQMKFSEIIESEHQYCCYHDH